MFEGLRTNNLLTVVVTLSQMHVPKVILSESVHV